MPEIPLQNKIDRYHVPLMVYSPLLKEGRTFRHPVSHFDITPTLLAYYRANYDVRTPKTVTWIGRGLAEGISTKSIGVPLMQGKNQPFDFVFGIYHLADGQLYKLNARMKEEPIADASTQEIILHRFNAFKRKNKLFERQMKLLPDSVLSHYFQAIRKP